MGQLVAEPAGLLDLRGDELAESQRRLRREPTELQRRDADLLVGVDAVVDQPLGDVSTEPAAAASSEIHRSYIIVGSAGCRPDGKGSSAGSSSRRIAAVHPETIWRIII